MSDKQGASQKKSAKAVRPPAVSPELRELIHMLEAIEAEADGPDRARDNDR